MYCTLGKVGRFFILKKTKELQEIPKALFPVASSLHRNRVVPRRQTVEGETFPGAKQ